MSSSVVCAFVSVGLPCSYLHPSRIYLLPRRRSQYRRASLLACPTRTYRALCSCCISFRGRVQNALMAPHSARHILSMPPNGEEMLPKYSPPTLKAFALASCVNNNIRVPPLEEFHGLEKKLCAR